MGFNILCTFYSDIPIVMIKCAFSFSRTVMVFSVLPVWMIFCFSSVYGQGWKAGVAKQVITPGNEIWMAGYASRNHGAEGTLQDLWIKALGLEDSLGNRALLITSDLLGLPRNMSAKVARELMKKLNLSRDQIILSSSHTHSGPVLRNALYPVYELNEQQLIDIENYSQWLEEAMVQLGVDAFSALQPASLYSGQGHVRFGVNRRNNVESTLSQSTELSGPIDHSVPVIVVRGADQQNLALIFGYACHATVLSFHQWSGDYPGFAQQSVEAAFPGAMAMFFAGAGGDVNPLPRRSVGLAQQYGQELASAVGRVVKEELHPLTPVLHTRYAEIELPYGALISKSELQEVLKTGAKYEKAWAENLLLQLDKNVDIPQAYPYYPVQTWQLGHQQLIALGGELVVDYAIRLKRLLGPNVFVMGYANDVMGYIPSLRILREGGYEGFTSSRVYGLPAPWAPAIEEMLIRAAYEQAQSLPAN